MSKFYDLFPLIPYDISKENIVKQDYITNIFLRFGFLSEVKNNTLSYYEYLIRDQDTPENLADRLYDDPEYHWVILLMNDIVNPLFDWPLKQDAFDKFIIDKYGNRETAQALVHNYEQIIRRTDVSTGVFNEIILEIDLPAYNALPVSSLETKILSSGKNIEVLITRRVVDCYTWENDKNETKRNIKLLKKEYLPKILGEFQGILSRSGVKSIISRRIVR